MKGLSKLLISLLVLVCLCACVSNAQKIQKQLELGNKFLAELDYEQAILAFNKVIEIDPKNTDGYLGLGDAYYGEAKNAGDYSAADTLYTSATENYGIVINLIGDGTGTTVNDKSLEEINQSVRGILAELYVAWSDLALKEGDSDHAAKILEDGYTILGDDELLERSQTISDIKDAEQLIGELDVSSDNIDISLADSADKLIAITDLCNGKYISNENGQGFGLYKIDGSYYLFRGSFKNGLREGSGLLMLISKESETYVKCGWKDDVPYGSAEYFNRSDKGYTESATFQLINGLYDGKCTASFQDGENEYYTMRNGKFVNLGSVPEDPGFFYYSVDANGELFGAIEKDAFEQTAGMPGYADHFMAY
ncbi:tetratricopeptide repeat protein [Oribacterium sp. FC2011]|uniref:tetratricopeptide repeat protein n=1 Tax=Oribacterium sp. FC2011 TaxID=1408311 RepID=UPI0004E0EC47|nr:tetratricopeptide repeat protein [Oribacterium sp. FC2011]